MKKYICPFCHVSRKTKKQMDFHLKYGHADLFPLMTESARRTRRNDLEKKLSELIKSKENIEREIEILKTILDKKT